MGLSVIFADSCSASPQWDKRPSPLVVPERRPRFLKRKASLCIHKKHLERRIKNAEEKHSVLISHYTDLLTRALVSFACCIGY